MAGAPKNRRSRTSSRKPEPRRRVRVTPKASKLVDDGKVRLNRFLAEAGICSRRAADGLIEQGRIEVNGEVVSEMGHRVHPLDDDIRYDGQKIQREKPVYLLFNKPKDVICTNARNEIRRRAVDFLQGIRGRIYTVGRLDAESEGLILLTNDGEFANIVAHPRHSVPKTYAVLVRGRMTEAQLQKARGGVWLAEGRTGGAGIRVDRTSRDRTYLKVTIREGRNREIRRVFARLGHNVISLKRVRIGTLSLHGLKPGAHRFLSAAEVSGLLRLARQES